MNVLLMLNVKIHKFRGLLSLVAFSFENISIAFNKKPHKVNIFAHALNITLVMG